MFNYTKGTHDTLVGHVTHHANPMHTVWCLVRGRNVARVAPLCVDAAYGLLFHFQPRRALTPRVTYLATVYAVTHDFSPVVLQVQSSPPCL